MNLEEAQTELVTVITAIGEYVSGTRKKRIKFMTAGVQREREFDTPADMFKYLTARRVELESFIASFSTDTTTVANSFAKNKNIPLVFRR